VIHALVTVPLTTLKRFGGWFDSLSTDGFVLRSFLPIYLFPIHLSSKKKDSDVCVVNTEQSNGMFDGNAYDVGS
jgi:hypothetical protein